ncbi:MAG: large subunit ribosomal protein L15 [Alphaproteobacteria bacterium]|jgi:large subunit ribosomal protein L15
MKLNELADNKGARKLHTRVGRGEGSKGKTSGRGQKGLGARSGGKVFIGFEGGQNPLYRRLPMRGFNNFNFRTVYTTINVGDLEFLAQDGRLDITKPITIATLQEIGYTKKAHDGLKVLGHGDVTVKFIIEAKHATKSAIEKIEKAGGKLNLIAPKPDMSGIKLKKKADR